MTTSNFVPLWLNELWLTPWKSSNFRQNWRRFSAGNKS